MKNKYIKIFLSIFITISVAPCFALAASDKLPEMMVGQTKVVQGTSTYYGGEAGSQAIYNYAPAGNTNSSGDNTFLGFDQTKLATCYSGLVITAVNALTGYCFGLEARGSSPIDLMVSRTYIDSMPATEVAALFYSPKPIIVGDSYMGADGLSNFAYWGKHLAISSGSVANTDAYWGVGNYTMNKDAQASLVDGSAEYKKYIDKINIMKGEAKDPGAIISAIWGHDWYMQGSNIGAFPNDEKDKYPEGKVWVVDSLDMYENITYRGNGTIIVEHDLNILTGVSIKAETKNDHLGFIVLGNVKVNNGCDVQASIFTNKNIKMNGDNTTMTGSFVAQKFDGMNRSNLRFYYDYNFSESWPPGFRYLNMPHPN